MGHTMKIGKKMITEEQIEKRVTELAEELNNYYGDREVIVIGILKGCFVFMADLVKRLTCDARVYFMEISSYKLGTVSCGKITIKKDLDVDIEGKDVLIAEDIIDSGNTLSYLLRILSERQPESIRLITLLNKPDRREKEVEVDDSGFVIPDVFVVGYGLDYAQKYRNLPYIGVVEV